MTSQMDGQTGDKSDEMDRQTDDKSDGWTDG